MKLIGMLDSPYVRRVAITLDVLGIPFEHDPLSVFSNSEAFMAVNPLLKAPSFVTDDGVVLMDSELIIGYVSKSVNRADLWPSDLSELAHAQRLTGLALAACEKTVQIIYEYSLRPPEKQYVPWVERITRQLHAAYRALEAEMNDASAWLPGKTPTLADITIAVAWRFTQEKLPGTLLPDTHKRLAAFSQQAEASPSFRAYPYS